MVIPVGDVAFDEGDISRPHISAAGETQILMRAGRTHAPNSAANAFPRSSFMSPIVINALGTEVNRVYIKNEKEAVE